MKTETVLIPELNYKVNFLIGRNAQDNFDVIDEGFEDDLWFHAKDVPSCHVVCLLPNEIKLSNENIKMLIQKGAEFCKQYTKKISHLHNIPFIYAEIKNITKSKTAGLVYSKNTKIIIV